MDLSLATVSPDLLKPTAAPAMPSFTGLTDDQKRVRIDKTAHAFEASFLSVMLGQMFDGVETKAFGGGEGEQAFKSFLTDAMAKSMAGHGGIGLSKTIKAEMLTMQGLAPAPAATPALSRSPPVGPYLDAIPANAPSVKAAA